MKQRPRTRAGKAAEVYRQAVRKAEANDLPGAVRLYRRALELDPNELRVANNLAVALRRLGQLEEAEQTLKHAADSGSNCTTL